MAGNGITFDDASTGVSYEQFPKDPAAREAIAIVNDKVEALKDSTVSRQDVINLENKVKQSDLDKDNFKEKVTTDVTNIKNMVDGLDGGNTEKITELEAVVNQKANQDLVDSLANQIEGSVKQINGIAPDEEGNVIIDLNTTGLATKEEVTAKTDELAELVFSKAERADVGIIAEDVTKFKNEVTTKTDSLNLDLEQRGINVYKYINLIPLRQVTTEINWDWTEPIKAAIAEAKSKGGGVILLTPKEPLISASLIFPSNVKMIGQGMGYTKLRTKTNDFDAIVIESNARRVMFSDFDIISNTGIGAENSGIRANETNGGAEHFYFNMNITAFKYGTKVGEIWWNNTIQNVRWNTCDTSFYGNGGVSGQSINNLFIRCYSNEPIVRGFYIASFKNSTWYSCNFGGNPSGIASTYMTFLTNSRGMKLIGCNFEYITLAVDTGGITAWSDCEVSLDSCSFVGNKSVGNGRAFEIMTRDTAKVKVDNCFSINKGTGMRDYYAINNSRIVYENSPTMKLATNSSTIGIINMDDVIEKSISSQALLPKAKGVSTVTGADYIDPLTGTRSENIQVSLLSDAAVSISVFEVITDGKFKLKFRNLVDGVNNPGSFKVAWTVY